jgi:hypothetical protein
MVHISTDPEVDDDHVICAYQIDGYWGAVAKSNYSTLRGRDPVYQSIRELAMSYFDFYFSSAKVKSMTGYSDPVALEQFDERGEGKQGWMFAEDNMEDLDQKLCFEVRELVQPTVPKTSSSLVAVSTLHLATPGLLQPISKV